MSYGKKSYLGWLFAGSTILVVVFLVDVSYPFGVFMGYIYVIVAITGFFASAREAIALAAAATAANVLGYCLAPPVDLPVWIVAGSRLASMFTTWLMIYTGLRFHRQTQQVLATIAASNERRRLAQEQAARAQREHLEEMQLVTNAIPMMIGYLDDQERFQFINAAYGDTYKLPLESILGKTLAEIIGELEYNRLRPHVSAAISGKRVQFEEPVIRPDGVHWFLFQFLPRKDEQGRTLGFYSLVTDITGLKQSQEEVDRQREALALSNRRGAANEMTAALAHEINQPLGTIAVYSGRLLELLEAGEADTNDLFRALGLMYEEALRAGKIIKKARAMVDDKPLEPVHVDARQLLESVRTICSAKAATEGVKINLHLENNSHPIYADLIQMQQVLTNLVFNAIDACEGLPEQRKCVSISVATSDNGSEITVVDHGKGLPHDELDRIFAPHFTTKPNGLGIGLNICRSIVSMHGGSLWASPNKSHGVTIHIQLPNGPDAAPFERYLEAFPLVSENT